MAHRFHRVCMANHEKNRNQTKQMNPFLDNPQIEELDSFPDLDEEKEDFDDRSFSELLNSGNDF